ncbi:MAG: hypothetical protein COT15_01555 [Candidatus Diapherotrites archaeon CG08_land_8_20_14_0_20_34_12]|nr:MAG: hypothetical protein COT15_01555 [Candidatus Diapherotrites archaeon CG08_land_8_20_14_0_20_34_12]
MPAKEVQKESSIIQIIQDMVKNGESEEKIIATLQSLGVEPEKAKRLLLLGQADTFALLRNEISKIVANDLEKEKPKTVKYLQEQSDIVSKEMKKRVSAEVMGDLEKYEKNVTGQSKTFQQQMGDNIKAVTDLTDRTKNALNELGLRINTIEKDMEELKIKGVGSRNKFISFGLLFLGLIFCFSALYLFFTNAQVMSMENIIITVVMALVGITILFVATLV